MSQGHKEKKGRNKEQRKKKNETKIKETKIAQSQRKVRREYLLARDFLQTDRPTDSYTQTATHTGSHTTEHFTIFEAWNASIDVYELH